MKTGKSLSLVTSAFVVPLRTGSYLKREPEPIVLKTQQSGMPPEEKWQAFFDPATTLRKLGLNSECKCVVDFGCGYGTFCVPAAAMVPGSVHALDIEPEMVEVTRARGAEIPNLYVLKRDFVEQGSGLPDGSADYAMLFNILHAEESSTLLQEVWRVLKQGGKLAVMHWNYDPTTPRGPSMDIRVRPEACMQMVAQVGFIVGPLIDLPPYHYGFTCMRS